MVNFFTVKHIYTQICFLQTLRDSTKFVRLLKNKNACFRQCKYMCRSEKGWNSPFTEKSSMPRPGGGETVYADMTSSFLSLVGLICPIPG